VWLGGWRVLGVRPTGEGIRLLLLLAVMGFAAFNTRNNLLYLMFSVGLAGTLVSVVSGWLSLRSLELESEPPGDLYAGSPAEERFHLRNGSRVFAAYGIQLEDVDFCGTASGAARVSYLAVGETVELAIEKVYPRRGVFASARMRLRTRFPFGFFETIRDVRAGRRLTVFPRVSRVDISFAFQERAGSVPLRQRRGESEELLRLRDYAAGDNLHHIHWKSTAKLGRLMTREFAAEQKRRFSIVFDPTTQEKERMAADAFETMVSAAASLASHLAAHGLSFSFVSPDDLFPHDASREHLRGVLSYLAAVVPRPATVPAPDLRGWIEDAIRGGDTVFLLRQAVGDWDGASAPQLHVIDPRAPFFQELRVGT
jgi:uncharacterized protein (DUF58 family)